MNKLDLNRDGEVSADELLSVLKQYDTKKPNTSVDKVIKKLAEGSSKFSSMRDYARSLIKQFDRDSDGIITFTELCDGLLKLKIVVTQQEKQGLMERLDIDRDGKITETEIYRVLLSVDNSSDQVANNAADQTIKKIAAGASKFGGSLSEYVKDLVKKFDRDSDGLLTIQELTDGLKKTGISLNQRDSEVLMNKFDLNRDGEVSADEILKVLQGGNATGPSIDHIILKLAAQGSSFPTMKDYAKSLIRKFDRDSDGIITFQEFCDGLGKMNLNISQSEKQALMDRLDLDRDGRITEKEMYRVLQNADSPHRRLGGLENIV
jgi:Ca2+-binding EF-hand superfamily protein